MIRDSYPWMFWSKCEKNRPPASPGLLIWTHRALGINHVATHLHIYVLVPLTTYPHPTYTLPTCIGAFFRTSSASASNSLTISGYWLAKFCDSVGSWKQWCKSERVDIQVSLQLRGTSGRMPFFNMSFSFSTIEVKLEKSQPVLSWKGTLVDTQDPLPVSQGSGWGHLGMQSWECPWNKNIIGD